MQTAINRQEDGTIELTVTIPWGKVKMIFDKLFEQALSEVNLPGFRKGKAPKDLTKDKIDKSKVYEEVIKQLIPEYYVKAVQDNNFKPIISPKIQLINAKENKDWQFKASFCEKPSIPLGNYRQAVSQLKTPKGPKIWTPGQTKKGNKKEEKREIKIDKIFEVLFERIKLKLPKILIEEEVSRSLTRLVDDTKKLGLTIDQYLKAKGKTSEQLRKEHQQEAEKNLSFEFLLQEIAEKEKIKVEEKEIEDLIEKEKDPKIKESLKNNRYYLASVLRRRKTIDFLISLAK